MDIPARCRKAMITDEQIDALAAKYYAMSDWYAQFQERKQLAKAFYLGYKTIDEMEDHLPWLETRFPEGAEL